MPSNVKSAIDRSQGYSFYLARLLAARPEEARLLEQQLETPFSEEQMQSFANWEQLVSIEQLAPALRALRRAVMARVIVRDLSGRADLDEVVTTVTRLAEFAVRQALPVACQALAQYGDPIGEESGEKQTLIVIGMGKLGGAELNASSDIDLIFI